jgi:transcriptional regulator GlxA family with amidase domain
MSSTTESSPPEVKVLNFGVLLIHNYQWLDAAGFIDYLNTHSHNYLKLLNAPTHLLSEVPIMNWHYLSSTGDLEDVAASAGPPHRPTTTFAECPELDYLVVPGPDVTKPLSEDCIKFVQERYPKLKGLFTICSGSLAIAQTGVLDGVQAASNKWLLGILAKAGLLNRKVKWVGDRRFVVDGKVWTGAGVTAGIDLAAEFARVHFPKEVGEFVQEISEYEPNPAQPDPFARLLEGVKLD